MAATAKHLEADGSKPFLRVIPEAIPAELKRLPQWVLWRAVRRDEEVAKVPFQPNGRHAKSNDHNTWCGFDAAWKAYEKGGFSGIGFVFSADDPFVGIDLDGCIGPDGVMADWAQAIVTRLASYTEISPSQTGVKVWVRSASIPERKKLDLPEHNIPGCPKGAGIEVYSSRRYFATTGQRWPGTPDEIRESALAWLLDMLPPAAGESPDQRHAAPNGQHQEHRRDRVQACLRACRRIRRLDEHDGSRRLLAYCCRCVEFDLSDGEALQVIRALELEFPFPRPWRDDEIIARLRQAEAKAQRGAAPDRRASPQTPHDFHKRADAGGADPGATEEESVTEYEATDTGFVWHKPLADGSVPVRLTNWTACITQVIRFDDGAEVRQRYRLEARTPRRQVSFEVAATAFGGVKRWAAEHLGPEALIYPGQLREEHVSVAIRVLSPDPAERTIYAHTGWRCIDGGWRYLHSGGGLGAGGNDSSYSVELPDPVGHVALPSPTTDAELREDIEATLRVLDIGPDTATIPSWCAIWRAILGDSPASLFLLGPTGVFKTQLAGLLQAHFGAEFSGDNLPANWSATPNAIEELGFIAKDVLLVIDDFRPAGPTDRVHLTADRIFRNAANRAARTRLNAAAELRPVRPPRCLYLATGEDLPRGQSLRARLVIVELRPGDIPSAKLSAAQADAVEGKYAGATAAFIGWLAAGRLEAARTRLADEVQRLRNEDLDWPHKRTVANIGHLLGAGLVFLEFAKEAGALPGGDYLDYVARIEQALLACGASQTQWLAAADPVARFQALLESALAAGKAHLAAPDGGAPSNPGAWGWREHNTTWLPLGDRIGWVGADCVYLDPAAAYRAAQTMATGGDAVEISEATLGRRLVERRLLRPGDGRHTTRYVRAEGRRRRVWIATPAFFEGLYCAPCGDCGDAHNPKAGDADTNGGRASPQTPQNFQ